MYGEMTLGVHVAQRQVSPETEEYKALYDSGFVDYRLEIGGLVRNPVELSLEQLRALPYHEQITQHFCIQGWSGVAKWGGISMQTILDLVEPDPEAKWVAFYSLGEGVDGGIYYDAHPIEHMRHHLTMLAYDMNGAPLSYGHGAPLRLRNESEHGFKQVKWLGGIEFIAALLRDRRRPGRLQPGPRVLRLSPCHRRRGPAHGPVSTSCQRRSLA